MGGVTPHPRSRPIGMNDNEKKISELLHEAAETHHRVFRITDGEDADWASWYSEWLVTLTELPDLMGRTPVRSELTCLLVRLDRGDASASPSERGEGYYAKELVKHFGRGE